MLVLSALPILNYLKQQSRPCDANTEHRGRDTLCTLYDKLLQHIAATSRLVCTAAVTKFDFILILSLRYVARIQTSLNSCDRPQRQWFSHVTGSVLLQCVFNFAQTIEQNWHSEKNIPFAIYRVTPPFSEYSQSTQYAMWFILIWKCELSWQAVEREGKGQNDHGRIAGGEEEGTFPHAQALRALLFPLSLPYDAPRRLWESQRTSPQSHW